MINRSLVFRTLLPLSFLGSLPVMGQFPYCTPGPANGYTLPARFSYAVKFVCGAHDGTIIVGGAPDLTGRDLRTGGNPLSPLPPREAPVKRGNYATVVNVHNPYNYDVSVCKKVVLAAPEKYPNLPVVHPTRRYLDLQLLSDHAMSIDCTEIVNLLTQSGTPPAGTFLEGFVVVDVWPFLGTAPEDVDVVAVTSSDTFPGDPGGRGPNHEVTRVPGRQLPAGSWLY